MVIVNTTIHIDIKLLRQFASWLKQNYIPAAEVAGGSSGEVLRVMGGKEDDPEGVSVACRISWPSLAMAHKWHSSQGLQLLQQWVNANGGIHANPHFTTFLSPL